MIVEIIEAVRQTITAFCVEFIKNPYLCYTEHGQHALFYAMLFDALPEEYRYLTWQSKKICVLQKEYPTADCLGKSQRQHWDIAVLHTPPESIVKGAKSYDYLKLQAAIEFGLNEKQGHLLGDLERLGHRDSNLVHGFIVHLYRLSQPGKVFSNRDWPASSARILTPAQVQVLSTGKSAEIFYGIVDSSDRYKPGLWNIKDGQMVVIR